MLSGGLPGSISAACYHAQPGYEEALPVEVRDQLTPLRAAGLVAGRASDLFWRHSATDPKHMTVLGCVFPATQSRP
jgi:hypothetical protein